MRGPTEVVVCPYMPADAGPYACMPLAASGSPLGALFLEPDERSIAEDSFVRAAADRVSLTIANRRLLETARRQATTDELTGLFNRRFMDEQLRLIQALAERHGEPYSIVRFDLDSLKDLNDALGHDAGDQGLRSFARILSRTIRTSDVAVRAGGDEFVILAPRTGLDEAVHVAERVREATHAGGLHDPRLAITVSAGVASWQPGRSVEEVLSLADAMLYEAKRAGRDRVVAQPAAEPSPPA
ncbi:MAG: GGDEF domain-containing protein [Chloroflexota bacterium]